MGKQSISVDGVKENFSIDNSQAESVIKQLKPLVFLVQRMLLVSIRSLWTRKRS